MVVLFDVNDLSFSVFGDMLVCIRVLFGDEVLIIRFVFVWSIVELIVEVFV